MCQGCNNINAKHKWLNCPINPKIKKFIDTPPNVHKPISVNMTTHNFKLSIKPNYFKKPNALNIRKRPCSTINYNIHTKIAKPWLINTPLKKI